MMPKHTIDKSSPYGPKWQSFQNEYDLCSDPNALSPSFFMQTTTPIVDRRMLEALKDYAHRENSDVRICLHSSPSDNSQNMIILHHKSHYYRPHAHSKNGESYQLIEGELGVFFFNTTGDIMNKIYLSMNDCVAIRIPINLNHAIYPLSKYVIFHESKSGPFIPGRDIIYPRWAPPAANLKGVQIYKNRLSKEFIIK